VRAFDLASVEAPDFVEPIEAWRVWRVVSVKDGYRLGSVVKPTLWPPGEPLCAECLRSSPLGMWFRRRREKVHAVPDEGCECGIYAGWLPAIRPYVSDPPASLAVGRVVGQVSLWGTVIECERGFRASRAYPLRLYVPTDSSYGRGLCPEALIAGLDVYGVPVEPLVARCSEAVGVLERKQIVSLRGDG
jgi:hypothetical protein